MDFSLYFNTKIIVSSSPMKWKDYKSSKFPRSSSKTYKRERKVGNHGGSPPILGLKEATHRAWGNKAQIFAHPTFTYNANYNKKKFNTSQYTPSQGLHIYSSIESRYMVKVGSLHEENFTSMNLIKSHIPINKMPFKGLSLSSPFIHLLIPPKNASNNEVHTPLKYIIIISTHGRVSQLHG